MSETAAFFHAMAASLTANVLTVTLVYSFMQIAQKKRSGEQEGTRSDRNDLMMLYGLYTWGIAR